MIKSENNESIIWDENSRGKKKVSVIKQVRKTEILNWGREKGKNWDFFYKISLKILQKLQ